MRLPDETSLPTVQPRSRRIVQAPQDNIGEVVSGIGRQMVSDSDREQAQADALDVARARADFSTRLLNERSQFALDKDPEYSTWGKRFATKGIRHRDASASLIRNPRAREMFRTETQDDLTRNEVSLDEQARGIDQDKRRVEGLSAIDQSIDAAANLPVKDSMIAVDRTKKSIDDMVYSGVLSPAQGAQARINAAQRFASLKTQQDIERDPEGTYQGLTGGPGEIYFKKLRKKESGGSDTAKAQGSSAYGRYQFTDGTWREVMEAHPELGLTADGRGNADQQERAIRAFTADNAEYLRSNGVPVSEANLYLAHFMGRGGAVKLLQADPNADAASLFPDAAKANPSIFYNKDGPRTVGEVVALQTKNFSGQNAPPMPYYAMLPAETKRQMVASAEAEWGRRETLKERATALERYQMKSLVDDDVAQIEQTGQPAQVDAQRVVDILGEDDAAKWLERRDTAAKTYAAVSSLQNMTDSQMERLVDELEPRAGQDNFEASSKIHSKVEARAEKLRNLRLRDPAYAVEDSAIVQEAVKGFDETPQSVQKVVKARYAAQDAVGIPAALQQPVTRAEAKRLIAPMEDALNLIETANLMAKMDTSASPSVVRLERKRIGAEAERQLNEALDAIETAYGPYAPKVMAFAIEESMQEKQVGGMATRIFDKIRRGVKPTKAEIQGMDAISETSLATKAVDGQLPGPVEVSAPPGAGQRPSRDKMKEQTSKDTRPVKTGGRVQGTKTKAALQKGAPSRKAVDYLLVNPETAAQFDEYYGPGAAEAWLPKIPR